MSQKDVRIAVVGGGIFGCTTALELSRAGYMVTLFEKENEIMTAASAINQYRMHRGYHYPRSHDTILSCLEATPLFEAEYQEAIIKGHTHYYAIAKEGSFLSGAQYLEVLERHGLPYRIVEPTHLNADMLDVVIEAEENLYDPYILKEILTRRLAESHVKVRTNTTVDLDDLNEYDFVVIATYAFLNSTFKNHSEMHHTYQYEVCEKIVVEVPEAYKGISTVVMDGPFMCIDPLGGTGYGVMGHVEHAIHKRSFGIHPEIPEELKPLLHKGIITGPSVTHAKRILEDSVRYMPMLKDARHVGSMYTIRTVLPKVDHTDERPTLVNALTDRVITIYSGKVGNSVHAARAVLALVESKQ